MSESIISNKRECYVCGTTNDLNRHHVFYGTANRKLSEKYGCWIWLCSKHHNMSDEGIHFNKALDICVKCLCQEKWEAINGSRADFIHTFGKSYL